MKPHPPADTTIHLAHTLEPATDARASIGLLALATDHTVEHEWRQLMSPPGVDFYTARMPSPQRGGPDGLGDLLEALYPAAQLLVPDAGLDVVAFACTSATAAMGENGVFRELRRAHPEAACTTPLSATLAALRGLGISDIGVVTPYSAQTNEVERRYLEDAGLAVHRLATFGEVPDREASRIDVESLMRAATEASRDDCVKAVFLSCSSLRCAHLIPRLEAQLGLPVVASNYAMAWRALRLAGVDDRLPHFGRLFSL
jgi:maleate isomerase